MSTAPLQQAVATTRGVLAAVTPDQLGAPTPCASWDVAALINHIIGAQHFFLSSVTGTPLTDPPDFAAGDYLAAFDDVSAADHRSIRRPRRDGADDHACIRRHARGGRDGVGHDRHVPARLGSREGDRPEHRSRARAGVRAARPVEGSDLTCLSWSRRGCPVRLGTVGPRRRDCRGSAGSVPRPRGLNARPTPSDERDPSIQGVRSPLGLARLVRPAAMSGIPVSGAFAHRSGGVS